jgi:hypothetical protein
MARGRGVEIGPGPSPRIVPSDATEVIYPERYGKEEYLKYNHGYSKLGTNIEEMWKRYLVGGAHQIPDDLVDQDFIFSSHVIEHLPNPLGHFGLWYSRLHPGGVVLGIVPALRGCFDFMYHSPTHVSEWVSLLDSDLSRPQAWQYEKYERRYNRTVDDMVKEDIRPHFSFLTEENLSEFLEECCGRFGYVDFWVRTGVNNVSIEFGLRK